MCLKINKYNYIYIAVFGHFDDIATQDLKYLPSPKGEMNIVLHRID